MRWLLIATLAMLLAGCHTTSLGRSVGWPAPQGSGVLPSTQR